MRAPDLRVTIPVALVVVVALVVGAMLLRDRPPGPVGVAPLETLRDREVLYLEEERVYIVATREGFIALKNDSQHLRHEVFFCPSSKMFEAPAHGEVFDRYGRYYAGPAASDMDRVESFVEEETIYLEPANVIKTNTRSKGALEPAGKLCLAEDISPDPNNPGFFASTE